MKNTLGILISIIFIFDSGAGQTAPTSFQQYFVPHNPLSFPIQMNYLKMGTTQQTTQFRFFIRQGSSKYPGDYFYPPDAFIPKEFISRNLHTTLAFSEIESIADFLKENILPSFSDSLILSSFKGYAFEYPNGPHREPYTMLADGDTVYVISGWLGKFLSFYRVVPGDFRFTVPELMDKLNKLTTLAKKIDEKGFRHESDSLNYLWEYVDKNNMFRIRNYLIKATLPPDPPDSPAIFYNLIEITKFYDKGVMP
jgi:hypothetical protein